MNNAIKFVCCLGGAGVLCGCQTVRESTPPRTATEELLLSTAAARAVADTQFPWLAGRKVFVEDRYFDSYDKGFAIGAIRQQLSASGALLVRTDAVADVIVEIRSGALSMDNTDTLLGIPSTAAPIPLAGSVQLPEVALYKSKKSDAVAKFGLFAYDRDSLRFLQASPAMLGRSYLRGYKILFVSWQRTDVPELPHYRPPKAAQAKAPAKPPPK